MVVLFLSRLKGNLTLSLTHLPLALGIKSKALLLHFRDTKDSQLKQS